eukprot:5130374-Pyramimonas_sp.AAC.2
MVRGESVENWFENCELWSTTEWSEASLAARAALLEAAALSSTFGAGGRCRHPNQYSEFSMMTADINMVLLPISIYENDMRCQTLVDDKSMRPTRSHVQ